MAVATKKNITHLLIFFFLVLLPLGQLFRLQIFGITIHLIDLVVGLAVMVNIFQKHLRLPPDFKGVIWFILVAGFSLIFSYIFFKQANPFTGFLYLARFVAYTYLYLLFWNLVVQKKLSKILLFESLLSVGIAVSILGWVQYLLFPDLRWLKLFGWDDHYYRLVSTFLDPAYTGVILVLSLILTISKFFEKKSLKFLAFSVFLFISLLFTYSRSSYLAFMFAASLVLRFYRKLVFLPLIIAFFLLVFLLPRPASEGVKLERLHSVIAKIENYKQTVIVFSKSPVFGIGFNNMCSFRSSLLFERQIASHSCGGSDNSLLFVLATTGIVGLFTYLAMLYRIILNTQDGFYGRTFLAAGLAILLHGQFTNTLFYNFILGWLAVLMSISRRKHSKS